MKNETLIWYHYALENLESAKILIENQLFNPCLQNIQQSIEKLLKAILIEKSLGLERTHDILELKRLLLSHKIEIELSDNDCDFLNSIYLPSKYPVESVLPHFQPNEQICKEALSIAKKVIASVESILQID